jgi:hypothetical protein
VVLTGPATRAGSPTEVPVELFTLLQRGRFFEVEVQIHGSGAWGSNAMLFTDWFSEVISASR